MDPVQGTDAIREAYRDSLAMHPTIDVQTLGVNRAGDSRHAAREMGFARDRAGRRPDP
jgi:hypothetical protein